MKLLVMSLVEWLVMLVPPKLSLAKEEAQVERLHATLHLRLLLECED